MFKQDLIREIIKDKKLDKDLVIVANTYQNISNEELIKKLELLNAFVNKKLFRYFKKIPEKRVMFICSIERVTNNTHSHIILRIPKEYDRNYVLKLMSDYFKKLGKRFILFNEKANNEIANVIYSLKSHHSNYDPEKLVVI
jgi:Cft2 family RNA processing exonuclease